MRTSGEMRAHLTAIDKIVSRWQSGEISLDEKRRLISEENLFYHGRDLNSAETGKPLTSDVGDFAHLPSAADEDRRPVLVQSRFFEEDDEKEPWWQR